MAIFALIDCNNFYVSCERIFNPKLRYKPVVVLSNNDGCIIARSNEAKLLGVQMGEPYFKMRERFGEAVLVQSSNYALYGDISHRVMQRLTNLVPEIEHYSIDESFARLDGIRNIAALAETIRDDIYQAVGIPVSVGIGETKVLAKVANHIAKKHTVTSIKSILNPTERDS